MFIFFDIAQVMKLSKEFILKKIGEFLVHTIFWTIVLFSYTYFFGYDTQNIEFAFSFSLFLMPVTISTTYIVIDKLIPDYLLKGRYSLLLLYCVYTFIISAYFIIISFFYGLIFLSSLELDDMAPLTRSPLFLFIAVYFIVFIASAIRLLQHNYSSQKANNKLKTKILEAQLKLKEQELNYLKMQIHPHFLFNTLNTLYGFALKKSEETPEMILKLSNLLDYLLYQSDKPSVFLKDEILHIEDYLELEKIRFKDTLSVNLQTDCSKKDIEIAPMLFIPFVENSFKHGSIVNGKLTILIDIRCTSTSIFFSIKNSIKTSNNEISKGIGLSNIKKRLDLVYNDNYQLDISQDKNWYTVELSLTI